MKNILKMCLGIMTLLPLGGCFGEDYDFSPPTVTISPTVNDIIDTDLKEANVDWKGENNEPYKKETKDISKLAMKQQSLAVGTETEGNIRFDSQDFSIGGLTVSAIKNNKKQELKLNEEDRTFSFPKEKGKYVIEVDLYTDRGQAQYVGNIVVK
ncbi:hypothetical protein O0Q50_23195 [Priestia aryabhattai]|uniref:Lipoprotein n=1 Tax=Priestia aryabhattai TaxID=412384 RepID=A0AAX6NDU2_PRIAR|nr:hypothetical protein [Priestia aryabhattai]MDU9694093.1 hypothetical protein [Priestia aryabhattai]NGY88611.1 hypothetical protein [Priestia megaterium]